MSEPIFCPFCGSNDVTVIGSHLWYTECDACGAKSAQYGSREAAIASWNLRYGCEVCQFGAKPMTEENMRELGWVRERTCHNKEVNACCGYFTCSSCGMSCSVEWGGDGWDTPDYCPNCGAKVLHDVTVPKLAGSITLENLQQDASESVENLHTAKIEMCHGDHPPYPLFDGDAWTAWFICSECTGAVDLDDEYCKHCGVKLEPYERMESGE